MELEQLRPRKPRFNLTLPDASAEPAPPPGRWGRLRAAIAGDEARLLFTAGKAVAWLGLAGAALHLLGAVVAAVTAGALAADVVTFFASRLVELPAHRAATLLETVINLIVLTLVVDLGQLFAVFAEVNLLPFGVVAFLCVGFAKAAWWVHHRVAGN